MFLFDLRTVLLMSTLLVGVMGGVLYAVQRSYPPEVAGTRYWALAAGFFFFVIPLYALKAVLPEWVCLSLANLLVFWGCGCMMLGTQRFYGYQANWLLFHCVWIPAYGLLMWWLLARPDFLARVVVSSLATACFYMPQLFLVWRHRERHFSSYFFAVLMFLQTVIALLRAVTSMFYDDMSVDVFNLMPIQRLYLYSNSFMSLLQTVSFLALTTHRVQTLLEKRSNCDPLTRMLNRRGFAERYLQAIKGMKRDLQGMSVMSLDIDHFKQVNDRYGHAIGDKVLVHIAAVIRQAVRETDSVARFGGEEFVVLMPAASQEASMAAARRIQEALTHAEDENLPAYTVSIGIAVHTHVTQSMDEIVASADAALYRAKEAGRNRIEVAPSSVQRKDPDAARAQATLPSADPKADSLLLQ